jgi:type I restriction enzyme S subunit
MSWQVRKLGEFISIKHGWAFKGEHFSDSGKYILLTPGNAYENGGLKLRPGKEKFYVGEFPPEYLMKAGDMLVVMTDLIQAAPILGGAIVVPEDDRFLHNQRLGLVELLPGAAIDKGFLYYLLNSPNYRAQVRGSATGATVRHTAPKRICEASVLVPDTVVEQRQVAQVLSAYDDLIATNQRRIALLEDTARRLYREWFVHLRFPGHESVPIRDGVPEGWAHMPLSDIADITMGQSPESKHYNADGEGLPFHQGVSDFGHRFVTHRTFTKLATRVAQAGDILCSVRAPVGRLNVTRDKIAIGRGLSSMRSRSGRQSLLFYQLAALFVEEDMIGGGAIFASVGKKELFSQVVLQPSAEIAAAFDRLASDIDNQLDVLDSQSRSLAAARDLLLPKLMSGQLDVSRIRLPDEVVA